MDVVKPEQLRKLSSSMGPDESVARLKQLSYEVNRIATTLAQLTERSSPAEDSNQPFDIADTPDISAEAVQAIIGARRLRARYFPVDLFADPAWDMLLDLFEAEITNRRVPVSSLCIAAAVPATTALRWLKAMVDRGIFIRRADPLDGRRVFVELAPDTSRALRRYFTGLEAHLPLQGVRARVR